jgi:hypothetical protein
MVITEIGGFVNNCKAIFMGVPLCPDTKPFTVRIVPPLDDGSPDNGNPLATRNLSHDDDPLWNSYESTNPDVLLGTGTYFALFGAQDEDAGWLLASTNEYQADTAALGFWQPGWSYVVDYPGASRVVGRLATPPELVADLLSTVDGYDLNRLGASLRDKLLTVERMLDADKSKQACTSLRGFMSQVEAQSGKAMRADQATTLVRKGEELAGAIGC